MGISRHHEGIPKKAKKYIWKAEHCWLQWIILISHRLVAVAGINENWVFLVRNFKVLAVKKTVLIDHIQERKGDSLFGCSLLFQAADNEKKSALWLQATRQLLIPFNNPSGACPCHCQTALSAFNHSGAIVFLHQLEHFVQQKKYLMYSKVMKFLLEESLKWVSYLYIYSKKNS